jgi:hypothetical protein
VRNEELAVLAQDGIQRLGDGERPQHQQVKGP